MNTQRKIVDDFFRAHGFNIPEQEQEWSGYPDPTDPDNYWIDDKTGERINAETGERTLPKEYCVYEVMKIVVANRHKISDAALDHALLWFLDFNVDMQRAFTFPKTIHECYTGFRIYIEPGRC